ncbi:hypothetical protein CF641_37985, partial [Burkholderia pseudomallei]
MSSAVVWFVGRCGCRARRAAARRARQPHRPTNHTTADDTPRTALSPSAHDDTRRPPPSPASGPAQPPAAARPLRTRSRTPRTLAAVQARRSRANRQADRAQ